MTSEENVFPSHSAREFICFLPSLSNCGVCLLLKPHKQKNDGSCRRTITYVPHAQSLCKQMQALECNLINYSKMHLHSPSLNYCCHCYLLVEAYEKTKTSHIITSLLPSGCLQLRRRDARLTAGSCQKPRSSQVQEVEIVSPACQSIPLAMAIDASLGYDWSSTAYLVTLACLEKRVSRLPMDARECPGRFSLKLLSDMHSDLLFFHSTLLKILRRNTFCWDGENSSSLKNWNYYHKSGSDFLSCMHRTSSRRGKRKHFSCCNLRLVFLLSLTLRTWVSLTVVCCLTVGQWFILIMDWFMVRRWRLIHIAVVRRLEMRSVGTRISRNELLPVRHWPLFGRIPHRTRWQCRRRRVRDLGKWDQWCTFSDARDRINGRSRREENEPRVQEEKRQRESDCVEVLSPSLSLFRSLLHLI